jgi:hypothetical protein
MLAQGGWISVDTSESILKMAHANLDCTVAYLEVSFSGLEFFVFELKFLD